jgi:hypothetical protein
MPFNCVVAVIADNETILRDCDISVGSAPNIPSCWIAKTLGLKIVLFNRN